MQVSKTMVDTYKELTYDEWANKNGITKKAGADSSVSALDETENRAMYKQYLSELRAEQAKNQALDTLEQGRKDTMRENAILTERAKEYAERRAALNGTASAGVSQTAMIDLYSQMAGNRANAQAQYDNQKAGIMQEYMNAVNEAKSAASDTSSAVAVERAAQRQNDESTLREVVANYTTKVELDEAIKEFERKYGEGSVPSDVMDAYNSEDASPGQVKDWIDIAKSDDYYDGKTISVYDASGKMYTKNNEDDSSSGFDLDDFENRFENKVLRMVAGGAIKNGDVIRDTTYSNANYVYLDGNFYKITDDAVEKFGGKAWDIDELEDEFFEEDEDAKTPGTQNKTKKS